MVAASNTEELKQYSGTYGDITNYFSIRYQIWLEDIVETYNQLNAALKDVQNVRIVSHELLERTGNVAKVTYENGVSFYINYLARPYTVTIGSEQVTIEAQRFVKTDASGAIVAIQ